MNNLKHAFCFLTLTLFFGCSFLDTEDDKTVLIKKDRAALNENVSNYKAILYKYFKVNYKISSLDNQKLETLKTKNPEIEALSETFNELMQASNLQEEKADLSVLDYIKLYRSFTKTKNQIKNFNEDILPSSTEIDNPTTTFTEEEIETQKATEHIVFAGLSLLLKDLGLPVCFYELSMVNPEAIPDGEFKAAFLIARNLMLYQNELYYLSEHELTQNIKWIQDNPDAKFDTTLKLTASTEVKLVSKTRAKVLILNHLLRGLDRLKMDNEISEKEALDDFEAIIKIARQSGLDNEITQAVEVYFYLKKEDLEKAILALKKLNKSEMLSQKEKKTIHEAISYLENRETGKVLNGVYDKFFLSKIVVSYVLAQAKEIDWQKVLEENNIKVPEEILQSSKTIKDFIENINKFTTEENLEKAKQEIESKGKYLWNKTKDLLE